MGSAMKNKKKLAILLPVIAIGVVLGYKFIQTKGQSDPNIIRVSGNIEVTDAEVSFKIAGRVLERLVSEGETVKAGQLVARLDSVELAQEVALRKAEVQAARAALSELEAGSRPEEIRQAEALVQKAKAQLGELVAGSRLQEIETAEAELGRAKAETERMRLEEQRHSRLYREGFVSDSEYDAARTNYEVAKARQKEAEERLKLIREGPREQEIDRARAALKEAQERYLLVKKGPRKETIEQSRARLRQAQEALALAETRLGYATLTSPLSGVVLSENVEVGEYVAPGTPVVTVGDLGNVWLRAYVSETDLGRVKIGQKVQVKTDTYPGKLYDGRVSFIASEAEFTPKNVQTEKERVKLVYRVKIDLKNPHLELKPGMPAEAEILVGAGK
jgi:HlyD family secretion protein